MNCAPPIPPAALVAREDLDRGLAHVLAAPATDAPMYMFCTRAGYNQRTHPDRLEMTSAGGVAGDFEMSTPWLALPDGSPDPRIQVSILPLRVLDLVWRDRDAQPHPGDTIIADLNVSTGTLPPGTLIRVGTAVLRVSDLWNDGCVKWKARYGRAAFDWVSAPAHEGLRLRGILCSVEQGGSAGLTDRIATI